MTPAKKIYTCTVCGTVGFWNKKWSYYGSLAHVGACPEDLIYCCSEPCQKTATKNINSGKWKLPRLRSCGMGGGVKSERKGY
jgi:hypothetical protein